MDRAKYSRLLKGLEDLEEEAILKIELNRDFLLNWVDEALLQRALGYKPKQIDLTIERAPEELLSKKRRSENEKQLERRGKSITRNKTFPQSLSGRCHENIQPGSP